MDYENLIHLIVSERKPTTLLWEKGLAETPQREARGGLADFPRKGSRL